MGTRFARLGFTLLVLASTGPALSGSEGVVTSSLETNKVLVRSLFKALNEGDLVTVRSTWRGKYTGVLREVPIAGKEVVVDYTNTYRIADARIVENWAAYDRLHLLEQSGFAVVPPPPASPAR
jgi:predicted SnoaL-like aldol condensation-catalyzing enzyme